MRTRGTFGCVARGEEGSRDRPFKASFTGPVHWEFPGGFDFGCVEVTTVTGARGQATRVGSGLVTLPEGNEIAVTFNGGTGRFAGASGEALWTYYVMPELIEGCDDPRTSSAWTSVCRGNGGQR